MNDRSSRKQKGLPDILLFLVAAIVGLCVLLTNWSNQRHDPHMSGSSFMEAR